MAPKLYSINKSRLGYAYQYKYTLLQLLKILLNGEGLAEVYVDHPFTYKQSINLSLDAKFEFRTPDKTCIYEIKSGNDFKDNKIEELKQILRNLYFYEQETHELHSNKFIIIAPNIRSRILDHWADFQFIKENKKKNIQGETQGQVRDRVYRQFGFGEAGIQKKDCINFIKEINFDMGPPYVQENKFDKLSDLEDQIVSEIDNFCKDLEVVDSALVLPSWSIAVELLEVISKCSENNKESLKEICNKFVDCLSRRKLLCDVKFPDGNKESKLSSIKDDISKKLVEKTNLNFREEEQNNSIKE